MPTFKIGEMVDPATGTYQSTRAGRSPHGIWLNTHDDLAAAAGAGCGKLNARAPVRPNRGGFHAEP